MTPTPTPRTDAEWQSVTVSAPWDAAAEHMAQVARELERELDFSEKTGRQIWEANEQLGRELVEARKQIADWQMLLDLEVGALRKELAAERALADRLAETLNDIKGRSGDTTIWLHPDADAKGCVDDCWEWSEQALAAWKEARRDP